jgi:hypothetical protein
VRRVTGVLSRPGRVRAKIDACDPTATSSPRSPAKPTAASSVLSNGFGQRARPNRFDRGHG